jgi:hypothetical protein
VLGTFRQNLGWRSDATFTNVALANDIPAGSQLALIFIRHDNGVISSVSTSFGAAGVISQVTGGGPRCAIVAVEVSDTGAEHTISLTFSSSGNGGRMLAFVFLDELDLSAQSAWLRDYATVASTSVTVDTEPSDLVLMAHGCWGSGPPSEPSGTATVIAPFSHDNNDQRIVSVNTPGSPTTTTSSSGSNSSAAAVSVIWTPPAGGGHATGVLRGKPLGSLPALGGGLRSG